MPIVKIYGGLGNQLSQYSFAHRVASLTREEIVLDVSFYKKRTWPVFQLEKLNIPSPKKLITFPERTKFERGISKILRRLRYFGWSFFKEEDPYSAYYPGIEKPKTYYDGYFGNERYFRDYRSDLIQMFTPRAKIEGGGGKFSTYLRLIEESESVAIHYRRGDYVTIGCALDNSYYESALKELLKRKSPLKIFLFSNDLPYAKEQMEKIDDRLEVIQVDLEEGEMKDIGEFELMKHCKHFIIANSTYSWWAAYLADRDEEVYAPKVNQWNEKAYPSKWRLIDARIQKGG